MTEKQKQIKPDSELAPELYRVARQRGTEPPFTGKYCKSHADGMYHCAVCGSELFSSAAKFDSHSGWPSFTEPVNREYIELREDLREGMKRTEVLCKTCGAHLGHVFGDGPVEQGGKRYCVNSVVLNFKERKHT